MDKEIDIAKFDGGYGRKGRIFKSIMECSICKSKKECIGMDGSENEYESGAICSFSFALDVFQRRFLPNG